VVLIDVDKNTLIQNCHKNIGPGARFFAWLVQRYESDHEVLGKIWVFIRFEHTFFKRSEKLFSNL